MSVGDSIDTRTAAGRLVLHVLMSVAQWERETIVERTTDALSHKQPLGERCGKVPFGWDLAGDGRSLIANPVEAEARAWIRQARTEGMTLRAIGDELIRRGIPPKTGGSWSPSTLRFIALADRRD